MQKIITAEVQISFFKVSKVRDFVVSFLMDNDIEFKTVETKEETTLIAVFRSERDKTSEKTLIDFLKENAIPFVNYTKMSCM